MPATWGGQAGPALRDQLYVEDTSDLRYSFRRKTSLRL
jgi:hypothetical protein